MLRGDQGLGSRVKSQPEKVSKPEEWGTPLCLTSRYSCGNASPTPTYPGANVVANEFVSRAATPDSAFELAVLSDWGIISTSLFSSPWPARLARPGVCRSSGLPGGWVLITRRSRGSSRASKANPTVNTGMRYVEAIGLRVAWSLASGTMPRSHGGMSAWSVVAGASWENRDKVCSACLAGTILFRKALRRSTVVIADLASSGH